MSSFTSQLLIFCNISHLYIQPDKVEFESESIDSQIQRPSRGKKWVFLKQCILE